MRVVDFGITFHPPETFKRWNNKIKITWDFVFSLFIHLNYLAVSGSGDPNKEDGTDKNALEMLYSVAYTIKMNKKGEHKIPGYFDFVVPPLEGLWWMKGDSKIDYSHKENFSWISMIHLPDFVTPKELDWAVKIASEKNKKDFSKVKFFKYN